MNAFDRAWKQRAMEVVPSWLFTPGPARMVRLHVGALLLRVHRWLWVNGVAI